MPARDSDRYYVVHRDTANPKSDHPDDQNEWVVMDRQTGKLADKKAWRHKSTAQRLATHWSTKHRQEQLKRDRKK